MKNIFKRMLMLLLLMTFSLTFLTGCKKDKEEIITRVTVDINPSIELMVDEKNKVVSVKALNDDGNVIIVGEAIVGKTADEAVQIIASVATDTGYIVKGNVVASENIVTISVSGDDEIAIDLYNRMQSKLSEYFRSENIQNVIVKGEALELEALRALALKISPNYTKDEVNQMNEQQVLNVIKYARLETALLYSTELEELYYKVKEYQISFVEKEQTLKLIESLDNNYQSIKLGYLQAVESLGDAIKELKTIEYNYLVSPDSDYQKNLEKLLAAKEELLAQKKKVAELDEGFEKEAAKTSLLMKENTYNSVLQLVQSSYNFTVSLINVAIANLEVVENTLIQIHDNLPSEIKTILTQNASEIETKVNITKASFFEQFEKEYSTDIEYYKQRMLEQKQSLEEQMNSSN